MVKQRLQSTWDLVHLLFGGLNLWGRRSTSRQRGPNADQQIRPRPLLLNLSKIFNSCLHISGTCRGILNTQFTWLGGIGHSLELGILLGTLNTVANQFDHHFLLIWQNLLLLSFCFGVIPGDFVGLGWLFREIGIRFIEIRSTDQRWVTAK